MVRKKSGRVRLPMGELEARVMNVLWDHDEWLTPGEVNDALPTSPKRAYTTVMTILVRLYDKGMVKRRKRGRAWSYFAIDTREQTTANGMQALLDRPGDRRVALANFVDAMSARERAELRRVLERRSPS